VLLSSDDRLAIHELLHLHGHLCDAGAFDRFDEIATEDVVYDVSDLGGGVLHGLDELRAASIALGAGNPVAHLVTNVVVGEVTAAGVDVVSKGLGVMESGAIGSVVYSDLVTLTAEGWRIARRQVIARRTPLAPYDLPVGRAGSAAPPR
jgi:hypothetical protein